MMENSGEMRADQHQSTSSVFAFDHYPGQSNLLNPNILPARLNNSNTCSNPQFQNIPPFRSPFQDTHASIQSDFSAATSAQNPQYMEQNVSQFPQFDSQKLPENNLFTLPSNMILSEQFSYPNITFNTPLNIPRFDPSKEASWQWIPAIAKGDGLVQFPFTDGGEFGTKPRRPGAKRRTDLAELESTNLPPSKQHITEEKMAEHMSRLHINSESAPSTVEPESVKNKRLYMCEEMRKLQTDPILPPCLLRQRPCTALVLWQPPSKVLNILGHNSNNNNNEERSRENNNKNFMDDEDLVDEKYVVLNNMDMDV